jgi:UDP-N-acetylglucosamine 2-epimerase (non-hydrolysing)/GDP/UDP-N,N'-diacetylbacillosamine 2-epimerase (hydrolysing)
MLVSGDTPQAIATSMGLGTIGFAQAYAAKRPDLLLVLGDRYEMHAAAIAAVPFLIPIAHIAGGVQTHGAIDDYFRHSITKLSHLHFAETEHTARMLVQLGEEPWRITTAGSLSVDHIRHFEELSLAELNRRFGLDFEEPPLLVTFHPETQDYLGTERQMRELLAALESFPSSVLFTFPNADTNGRVIINLIQEYIASHNRARAVQNLGSQAYYSFLRKIPALVGNSSSGMVEAASFELPVLNVGDRQSGRLAPANVISVAADAKSIRQGLELALSPEFRAGLRGLTNPYGDGGAAKRITTVLLETPTDSRLLRKRIHEQ